MILTLTLSASTSASLLMITCCLQAIMESLWATGWTFLIPLVSIMFVWMQRTRGSRVWWIAQQLFQVSVGLWVPCKVIWALILNLLIFYVLLLGFKLNFNAAHLGNELYNISWNNPFPGVFTFAVHLNNRRVFKTETEASYTTNWSSGDVCVLVQDKQGNNHMECDSLPPEGAWACLVCRGQ